MTALLLVAGALLPGLWIRRVSLESLQRARDAWLVGVWLVGTVAVGLREPWLGVLGAYLAVWWSRPPDADPLLRRERWEKARTLVVWAAIGATWFLALEAPPVVWAWLPTAWGVWAWALSAAMAWQVWRQDPAKVRGWLGMRSVAGAMLALLLPVMPLWAWPGPLVGLYLSGPSWAAIMALGAAIAWRWPTVWVWGSALILGALATLVVGLRVRVAGRAAAEWLPRGDTLDTLWARTAMLRVAWQDRRWFGTGPGSTPALHLRAAARGRLPEATGMLHNEAAQLALEYGVPGVLAGLLFLWRAGNGLALGDPYAAMVVAGLVLSCGTMALRVAPLGLIFLLACAEVASR